VDDIDEPQEPGIKTEPIGPLPTIDDLAKPLGEKDAIHLSVLLGEDIDREEAEELSKLFGREIPQKMVEKHNTRIRLADFLKPKGLKNWLRSKK
jgi:hypothetical protein